MTRYDGIENSVGKRIMHGLIAHQQVSHFASMWNSYWQSGIELNYVEGKPVLKVNVNTWLTQKNTPNTEVKEEFFIDKSLQKQKRVQTSTHGATKKEQQQKEENEEKQKWIEEMEEKIIELQQELSGE